MKFFRWIRPFAHILFILAIPLILIVSPLYLFVSPGFVRYEYSRQGFPPAERFSQEERLRISDVILHYLRGKASLKEMATFPTTEGVPALRKAEVEHLVDVKHVLDGFFTLHKIAILIACLSIIYLWYSPSRFLLPIYLRQGVWVTGGLILLVLLSSVLNFDLFFTRFHELFFPHGNWTFYVEDTLIQLYPLPFWSDTVLKLGLTILLEGGVLYALSYILPVRSQSE